MNAHFPQLRWLAALLLLVAAMVLPSTAWAYNQPNGEGTKDSPYQISNGDELYWFAAYVNGDPGEENGNYAACAVLTQDISVSGEWTPIMGFAGTFDGQGHTISGLQKTIASGGEDVGLFASIVSNAEIRNVGIVNCSFSVRSGGSVGGVCGQNYGGTITNCYNTGSVHGDDGVVGGICGFNFGTITNCYNIGSVNNGQGSGGICGPNGGTITNCYYLSGTATAGIFDNSGTGSAEVKTEEQFRNGEVAWLLNGERSEGTTGNPLAWYQYLNGYSYPVLDSSQGTVYRGYKDCILSYSNNPKGLSENPVHDYDNGICKACGAYQPATQNSGKYEIGNAGQLYWFADKVNNENAAYGSANAVLTKDITVNLGVLDASGNLANNTSGFRSWIPIGNYNVNYVSYAGTFDGQNHTISGLYFNNSSTNYVGLFGYSTGTIKNVGVVDSYFNGNKNVGGVCGTFFTSTITNCYNTGTVSGTNSVGGVCGTNGGGTITNCYNTGAVSGEKFVGGVCGSNDDSVCTLTNCYNTGKVSGNTNVGGVCGYNYTSKITNCYNTGTVSGSINVGGVCGKNDKGTIANSYFNSTVYSGNAVGTNEGGTVEKTEGKTAEQFASGEVAYLLSQGENGSVWGQTLSGTGKQDYPVLGGMPVYYRAGVYANTYGILTEGTQTITASSSPYVWYEFTPEASATYLFVAPANVALVKEDISGVATGSPCIAKELVAETTYYVCIPGAPTPQADLTIKRIEAADTLLKVGTNTAYITSPDALWYAFTPAETGYYQFSSTDIRGSICVNTEKVMTGIMQGITTSPIYSLTAKTTYYVCFSYAPGEYDLTIAKLNTTLQLGADNAIMVPVSTSEPIWYEFTPTETGTYQFSSTDIKGSICVNTTKTDDDEQNITTSPTYSLSAKTTYYVYVNYNPGEYKLTITKLSTTTALEAVVVPQIYAVDGRIVCEGEFRIYDLLGRDVTLLNGSLCGVYVVKIGEAAVKIVVR